MVVGLVQETFAILRGTPNRWTISTRIAIAWRICAALILTGRLALDALSINAFVRQEYLGLEVFHGPDPVELLFLLTMVIVLSSSAAKWDHRSTGNLRWRWIVASVGVALATIALHESGFIHKLTHAALEGVERSTPIRFQRDWAYPDHAAEGYRFFWTSSAAAFAVLASVVGFIALCWSRSTKSRVAWSALLIASEGLIIVFDVWYFRYELLHVSPEFAAVGIQSTMADWCLAVAVAGVAGATAAYLLSDRGVIAVSVPCSTPIHESPVILGMMIVSVIAFPIEIGIQYADIADNGQFTFWDGIANTAEYLVQNPWANLQVAVCVAAVRLAVLRWRRSGEQPPTAIPEFRAARFAVAFAGLTLIAATGIPALSAFAFASWFSPWSS